MSSSSTFAPPPGPVGADAPLPVGADEGRAILRSCFAQYRVKLIELVKASLEQTNDLFETHSHIPDGDVEMFRMKRGEWLERFDKMLCDRFERRLEGERRKGRRPDADASLATLRVLTAFDHDRQAALKDATRFLDRFTHRELAALDLRVEVLLGDPGPRDIDNPFAVTYVLDAVGASARAVYPNPRVWRPFMERLLSDLTSEINKLYISLNRFLADRGVLPEIKAALRARSEFRPYDDKELFPTFSKMLREARPDVPANIEVPETLSEPGAPPALVFAEKTVSPMRAGRARRHRDVGGHDPRGAGGARGRGRASARWHGHPRGGIGSDRARHCRRRARGLRAGVRPRAVPVARPADGARHVDAALRDARALAAARPADGASRRRRREAAAGDAGGNVVPLNLIPHIRAAIDDQISNDTDRITMDVIALLFDYIFRDRSIPDALRSLFGRLQVPIVKAALLDRTFFSDKRHSARQLLDNLADAAVGATHDENYRAAFTALAAEVVDDICRDFEIDVAVFRTANARLVGVHRSRAAEGRDGDDRRRRGGADRRAERIGPLARARVPPRPPRGRRRAVRGARIRRDRVGRAHGAAAPRPRTRQRGVERRRGHARRHALEHRRQGTHGAEGPAHQDDPVADRRAAPRRGARATSRPSARARSSRRSTSCTWRRSSRRRRTPRRPAAAPAAPAPVVSIHDYVSEMAVGTWLSFTKEDKPINARLTWVSPLRTKYLFTSRSRARAFVYTPEELAYELCAPGWSSWWSSRCRCSTAR